MIWKSVFLSIVLVSIMTVVACGNGESVAADETLNAAERIWAEIIPVEGTVTDYDIPLSFSHRRNEHCGTDRSIHYSLTCIGTSQLTSVPAPAFVTFTSCPQMSQT